MFQFFEWTSKNLRFRAAELVQFPPMNSQFMVGWHCWMSLDVGVGQENPLED